ncbi:hypothetical protein [Parvibaculum sp.]|uniref:hypothetical protein n=1 Tax=Parvibaculum sp. TaxID=2024848 RepID=UPI001D5BD7A3|nr:hypothetical protein [Parvibaculum sp.]MBX3490846.1 hypothetical protein [Parvibaculum sp.]
MKIDLGKVSIDLSDYASQGNAILGIRDSGKTYTATMIAERLMDAGVPIIAIDPVGIWRNLRVPAPGVKGAKGYPVVVAGGMHGDLPLTPQSAPEIVRAAMRAGVSIVLDLYSMTLSKADWKRIVTDVLRVLLYENKDFGLRHVFLEEAAEFCPQLLPKGDPAASHVYAEVEKLARMGGNALLGYTLINQRAEQVNKAVLELCDGMLLHRQKGKNSLNSLEKWLDLGTGAGGKEIRASLPMLTAGECWYWPPMSDIAHRVQMPSKRTFHPDRRAMRDGTVKATTAAVDVSAFVKLMKEVLPKITAEAEANDPKVLKAEIAKLKKELAAKPATVAAAPDPKAIAEAEANGFSHGKAVGKANGYVEGWDAAISAMRVTLADLPRPDVPAPPEAPTSRPSRVAAAPAPVREKPKPAPVINDQPKATAEGLTPSLQRVLDALAWWRHIGIEPVRRERAAVVAGYSPKASTFGVYIADLAKRGLVATAPGTVQLTDEGLAAANTPSATSQEDLRLMARELLEPQPARVFDTIYDAYPASVRRDDVAESVGLSPKASTCGVYIAKVAAYGIIEADGRGTVRAADWLFP